MPSDTYTLVIADAGVSTPADSSVTTVKIADYNVAVAGTGVTTAKIVDSAVTSAKILNGTITGTDIASGTITTSNILDGTITGTDIASGTITSANIVDGTIVAGDIAANAITTTKILDSNVTTDKIANNNVTVGKIQQVGANKILGNSIGSTANLAEKDCSALAFTLLANTTDVAMRSTLGMGVGAMATQSSSAVAITGGTITGITFSGPSVNVSSPTGTLPADNGGTGLNSYEAGDLLYATGAASLARLAKGSDATTVLHASGSGASPTWSKINLATDVTGTLPVTSGGTGVTQSAYGEYYISSIAATTIVTAGQYVKVAGTTTASTLSNFTHTSGNRLTYTGTATRKFFVSASVSFHGNSGTDFAFAIGKNNNIITASIVEQTGESAADLSSVSVQCIVELANTEFIEVFTTSMTSPHNPTVDHMNVVAIALI